MDTTSSFEISSETLEKTFDEYEKSNSENYDDDACLIELKSCKLDEIKNPVQKKVAEIAQLRVKSNMSAKSMRKMISIINDTPGTSIEIPNNERVLKTHLNRMFEPKFYMNCPSCKEVAECPGSCTKCNAILQKQRDNFFVYLPIEPQIINSISENIQQISEYLNRTRCGGYADADDGEVQRIVAQNNLHQKILSFTILTVA